MRSWIHARLRSLGAAPATALALATLFVPGACGGEPPTELAPEDMQEMVADMISYEMDTYFTNPQGIKTGRIQADTAYFFQDSTVVHMQGVEMSVNTETGQLRATVTADKGRFDERTQQMHAIGNVVLVMPNENRRVESGELYYDPMSEKIWSDSASTYTNQGQVTRGSCFESDMNFTRYRVCNIRGSADLGSP
jgi:LPS export ABC transporter protein LptC